MPADVSRRRAHRAQEPSNEGPGGLNEAGPSVCVEERIATRSRDDDNSALTCAYARASLSPLSLTSAVPAFQTGPTKPRS